MDPYKRKLTEWTADEGISPQSDTMRHWIKGVDFHWLPSKTEMRQNGLESLVEGWKPDQSIINPETRVIALGSCFARYFILWLAENGFNKSVPDSPYNAIIRNAFAFENVAVIAQQLRWAFGEFNSQDALWINKGHEIFEATEERRLLVRQTLQQTDVLVLTLGLSEVWYDQVTNEPLWRTVPRNLYDPQRHVFRIETTASTLASLQKIDELRERYLPDLKIIFTLSPVRLRATFRPISAITANSASKAILRASLDDFLRSKWDKVNKTYFYFLSYEMVTEMFREPFRDDNRHLYDYIPSQILSVFARLYTTYKPGDDQMKLDANELPLVEQDALITQLEAENIDLQRICAERLKVIEGLETAGNERLQLIQTLEKVANERLEVIERLNKETKKPDDKADENV